LIGFGNVGVGASVVTKTPKPNYSLEEVEALIEGYADLEPVRYKLKWLVRLCDLDIAIRQMPPKEYQAVLLVGLLGLSVRAAGSDMGVSPQKMWRRYRRGLEWLVNYLNGAR
jgi:DNA-directed RNA polymerase specialized sigma24 family protein